MKIKNIVFFLFLYLFTIGVNAQFDKRLIGEWTLVQIVSDELIMKPPSSVFYYLTISKSGFNYSLGVNTCDLYEVKTIKNSSILGVEGLCTEACCDEKLWKHSNKIDYKGNYSFKDKENTLVISNKGGRLYLRKQLKRSINNY